MLQEGLADHDKKTQWENELIYDSTKTQTRTRSSQNTIKA